MEEAMRIVLVGRKNGKAVIRWPQYLSLSLVLSFVIGAGVGSVFYMLSGHWSHGATLCGIIIGIGITGLGLINGLRTPTEKLTPID
jgi:hypothetical protein